MNRFKKILLSIIVCGSFLASGCQSFNNATYSITLDKTNVEIYKGGEEIYLRPTITSSSTATFDKTIIWQATDPTVVSVNNGYITGLKAGVSTVYATLSINNSVYATCNVTVKEYVVGELYINPSSLDLDLNGTTTGNLKVGDGTKDTPQVKWSSSDSLVASVNTSGTVTAKSVGTATITATLKSDDTKKATCLVSVIDSTPSKEVVVTLDKTNANIHQGKTLKLNATVKNANDTKVIWSTSNSLITVSNDGLVSAPNTIAIGTSSVITATSNQDKTKSASCVVTVVEQPEFDYDYTIMLYMCASTLEHDSSGQSGGYDWSSYSDRSKNRPGSWGGYEDTSSGKVGLFTEDIKEILSVTGLPESVKIIIETGGTEKWYLESSKLDGATSISASKLQRWEVSNGKLKLIETLNTNYMAKEDSFQSFLEWGLNDYNAEQMGVIISGHGGGIAGCAYDDNYLDGEGYENTLNNSEIYNASKNALANYGRDKFTWIGYDACVMQTADTATMNADNFEYMVASQESENGSGWNHDEYLPLLKSNPQVAPETLLPKICTTFLNENHSSQESSRDACLQTLSVLNLEKIPALVTAFNDCVSEMEISQSTYNLCKTAFKSSYNSFGEKVYGLADFGDFLKKLKNQFATIDISDVQTAIKDLVMSNSYCDNYKTIPCGVNVFFPECIDTSYQLQPGQVDYTGTGATKFTGWQELCLTYGNWDW